MAQREAELGESVSGMYRKGRKETQPCAVFCTHGRGEGQKSEQQVQGLLSKAGNRKGIRMEARRCGGGQACILLTQGSIRPNVKYVWLSGHLWGLETSM